jgi:hypothetical protein
MILAPKFNPAQMSQAAQHHIARPDWKAVRQFPFRKAQIL